MKSFILSFACITTIIQYSYSQHSTPISKAVNYFQNEVNSKNILPVFIPVIAPISDYYKLQIDWENGYYMQEDDYDYVRVFSPFYNRPSTLKREDIEKIEFGEIDKLLIYAIYDNIYFNKSSSKKLINNLIAEGNYELTHAYIAILLLKNRIKPSKIDWSKQENACIEKMSEMAMDPALPLDLRIECIAFLAYGAEMYKTEWFEFVLNTQNEFGFWGDIEKQYRGSLNNHTTILALWALLEYEHSDDVTKYLYKIGKAY